MVISRTTKEDPKLFDSLYHDFEKMCYDGFIPIRDIAPLHNFDVSDLKRDVSITEIINHGLDYFAFKPIQLEENLRLKQITHEEFRVLLDLKESESLTVFEVGEPTFVIECDVNESVVMGQTEPSEKLGEKYQSEDPIDAVMTALRLFRSSFIGYSNIIPFKECAATESNHIVPTNQLHQAVLDLDCGLSFYVHSVSLDLKTSYDRQNRLEAFSYLAQLLTWTF